MSATATRHKAVEDFQAIDSDVAIDDLSSSHVCPFCGSPTQVGSSCPRCALEDTAATRNATKLRAGPWYVLQARNPAAPGMNFATLKHLVTRGVVTRDSVVRGPTTNQFWRQASRVRGLSRELGVCHSCQEFVDAGEALCPHCNRPQTLPFDPDVLLDQPREVPPAAGQPERDIDTESEAGLEADAPRNAVAVRAERPEEPERSQFAVRPPHRRRVPVGDVLSPVELAKIFQVAIDPSQRPSTPQSRRGRALLAMSAVAIAVVSTGYVAVDRLRETPAPTRRPLVQIVDSGPAVRPAAFNVRLTPAVNLPEFITKPIVKFVPPPADVTIRPTVVAVAQPATPAATVSTGESAWSTPVAWAMSSSRKPSVDASTEEPSVVATLSPADDPTRLWSAALEAESRRDFPDAVRHYERIESLPDNLWPVGLKTRLDLARQEMALGTD